MTLDQIGTLLESYATRGVFRGFSRGPVSGSKAIYRMLWHRDRFYDLEADLAKATLHIPQLLPKVPARSEMDREFQAYIESRHSTDLPEHRRIDATKAHLEGGNRRGAATLTMKVNDGDYEYAVRKLVHAVHEVFLDFLSEGKYYEWQIEVFDLDPDRP